MEKVGINENLLKYINNRWYKEKLKSCYNLRYDIKPLIFIKNIEQKLIYTAKDSNKTKTQFEIISESSKQPKKIKKTKITFNSTVELLKTFLSYQSSTFNLIPDMYELLSRLILVTQNNNNKTQIINYINFFKSYLENSTTPNPSVQSNPSPLSKTPKSKINLRTVQIEDMLLDTPQREIDIPPSSITRA